MKIAHLEQTIESGFVGTGYNQSNFNIGYSATATQTSYAAQNKLTITTDGKIGIGTSNPDKMLTLETLIAAQEVLGIFS